MIRWQVKIEDHAEAELYKLLKDEEITKNDIRVLLKWVDEMEEYGPEHIASSPEWHDHELERDWIGYRSSAFSKSGRVIYKILESLIIVQVARVTTRHNYRK